jgi:xanthine dehydrogenase accessory factor
MYIDTLQALNTAYRQLQPVALLTDLQSGKQSLYYSDPEQEEDGLSGEHKQLAEQVLRQDRSRLFEGEDGSLFIQPINPPLRMIIIGAVHIAQPLITVARQCHYSVSLIDPRQSFASEQRFPDTSILTSWPDVALQELAPDSRTAIITLSHDPKLDDPALEIALRSKAFYIGSLGSRRTHAARIQRLAEKGFNEEQQARIQGPIGLDIGAQSPAEIAIAIMAEVIQAKHSDCSSYRT